MENVRGMLEMSPGTRNSHNIENCNFYSAHKSERGCLLSFENNFIEIKGATILPNSEFDRVLWLYNLLNWKDRKIDAIIRFFRKVKGWMK